MSRTRKTLLDSYDFCDNFASPKESPADRVRAIIDSFRYARLIEEMRRAGETTSVATVTFENPVTGEIIVMPLMNMFPREGKITLAIVRERVRRWIEDCTSDPGNFLITGFGDRPESEHERMMREREAEGRCKFCGGTTFTMAGMCLEACFD